MAKNDETEVFKCDTCGLVTTEKGHLQARDLNEPTPVNTACHRHESEACL